MPIKPVNYIVVIVSLLLELYHEVYGERYYLPNKLSLKGHIHNHPTNHRAATTK